MVMVMMLMMMVVMMMMVMMMMMMMMVVMMMMVMVMVMMTPTGFNTLYLSPFFGFVISNRSVNRNTCTSICKENRHEKTWLEIRAINNPKIKNCIILTFPCFSTSLKGPSVMTHRCWSSPGMRSIRSNDEYPVNIWNTTTSS